MLRRTALGVLAASALVTAGLAAPAAAAGALTVTSPDDVLGVGSRLVFSTVGEQVREARSITLHNPGTTSVKVSSLALGGPRSGAFRLAAGQATSFVMTAGASRQVALQFVPRTAVVENTATLTVRSSVGARVVALAGLDAAGYEGADEPTAQQIVRTLGYSTSIGSAGSGGYVSDLRTPKGDERISPYWVRADASSSVRVLPLARYVSRGSSGQGTLAWFAKESVVERTVFSFIGGSDESGGQNQRLLPGVSGSQTFSTNATFGLVTTALNEYSDDGRNGGVHDWRFYPAETPDGAVIPDAWIGAVDASTVPSQKNYDYQDNIVLLLNARPALALSPGPSTASLSLGFDVARAGTVRDGDGQGTGFDDVQPNTGGTQYAPSRIDLDTASGQLHLTSSAGSNDGTTNTQQNALRLRYDGSRKPVTATGQLVAPFAFVDDFQQAGVFIGPDQDNYLKVEVEHADGRLNLAALYEARGTTPLTETTDAFTRVPLPPVAAGTFVALRVTADPVTGTLQASYRIGGSGSFTDIGDPERPDDISRWFSTTSNAGVLVSNTGGTSRITASFGAFALAPG